MPSYYPSSILWLFLAPALGGFLFGYDIGGTSYAILQLASLDAKSSLSLQDQPLKTGWFVSAPSAGALLGTSLLIYLEQTATTKPNKYKWLMPMGRRNELHTAGILYALGGCLQFLSPSLPLSFLIVCIGRWIYGAGIGFAMHGGPTYLAETTPASVRGMVVGAKEIAIVLGILVGYMVGNHLCGKDDSNIHGWAQIYGWTMLGATFMILCSKWIPESPRYLVSANHQREVRARLEQNGTITTNLANRVQELISAQVMDSLAFVWHPERAKEQFERLLKVYTKQSAHKRDHQSLSDLISDPSIRPALNAGLGLVVLQQITGQPSVLSYATPILASIPGLGSNASVLLALFKVVATSVSVVLVERNGRKTLLRVGCWLMLLALVVLAVAFRESARDGNSSSLDATSGFALLGMFAYIAGYQIGFGPITWLMISEVFPQRIRGTTVALAVQANFALNAAVQLLVPILETYLGMSRTFGMFGMLTAYSLWFVQSNVPETKGLTLEEIEDKLATIAGGSTNQRRRLTDNDDDNDDEDERIRLLP